jgi:hypothetical protein
VVTSSNTGSAKIKKWDVNTPVDTAGSVPWSWMFGADLQFNTSRVYRIPTQQKVIPAEGVSLVFTVPDSGSFAMSFNCNFDLVGIFGSKRMSCNQTVLDFTTAPVKVVNLIPNNLVVGLDRPSMDLDLVNGETYFFNIRNDNPSASSNRITVECTVTVYS